MSIDVDKIDFTFSDTIAGCVVSFDDDDDSFGLRTSDGRQFKVSLTGNTFASGVRNFGQPYQDMTGTMREMLEPERFLFAYGIFYSEANGHRFEAKQLMFPSTQRGDYVFEEPDWWINQARRLLPPRPVSRWQLRLEQLPHQAEPQRHPHPGLHRS
jgi:hypothetical protein